MKLFSELIDEQRGDKSAYSVHKRAADLMGTKYQRLGYHYDSDKSEALVMPDGSVRVYTYQFTIPAGAFE